MIDAAGNCGMQYIYNEKGWLVEVRSVGPDLKPLQVKAGWVISRNQLDDSGRVRRTTFHGLSEEPVLREGGYHGSMLNTTTMAMRSRTLILVWIRNLRCSLRASRFFVPPTIRMAMLLERPITD